MWANPQILIDSKHERIVEEKHEINTDNNRKNLQLK